MLAVALAATFACTVPRRVAPARRLIVLAVNDVYRIGAVDGGRRGGLARLRTLRADLEREAEVLLLHAGDFLFPSLLSRTFEGEQMIDVMNALDGAPARFDPHLLVTFGNHELERRRDPSLLRRRIAQSDFRWLGSNVRFAGGDDGRPLVADRNLVDTVLVERGGVRVGVFSISTDIRHPTYVDRFEAPEATARRAIAALRAAGAELVIALTHLRMSQDQALLAALGADGPDLVIGGHEHSRQAELVAGRFILKADADARSATVARVSVDAHGAPRVQHAFVDLGPDAPRPDRAVAARVEGWRRRQDRIYCAALELPLSPGCLDDVLGHTRTRLVGEELEIRRFETNLGNWLADQALAAFAAEGAQVAFLNAGSMRLNQDLPPGAITRRHLGELFGFDTGLVLVRIDGAVLRRAMAHAVSDWTGNGWFAQVAGFAFHHDPAATAAEALTLLTAAGPRPIDDGETLLAVVSDYLVDPAAGDQDGYTMLAPAMVVDTGARPLLAARVAAALAAAGEAGIGPEVEGRICNPQRPGPCLVPAP